MHHQNALLEAPLVGMAPVEGLREHHLVFSGKRAGRQRFGLAHAVERGDAPFDLAVGRPKARVSDATRARLSRVNRFSIADKVVG